jgi:hypothetical protein
VSPTGPKPFRGEEPPAGAPATAPLEAAPAGAAVVCSLCGIERRDTAALVDHLRNVHEADELADEVEAGA